MPEWTVPRWGIFWWKTGGAFFFCRSGVAEFFSTHIERIGGVGVRLSSEGQGSLPDERRFQEFRAVVASARLDCVAAASASVGRRGAAEMIRSEHVLLNHRTVTSVAAEVHEGDVLSVRGKGRFVIDRLGPVTKKGRLSFAGRKYM